MSEQKYGFVYIWYDRKHKRYYIGCRWGNINDGYICSSRWMTQAYGRRPYDFKRRVLKSNIPTRKELFDEEERWLKMIKPSEMKPLNETPKYYNLNRANKNPWYNCSETIKTVGQKISKAKKGKKIGPCTPERAHNISKAKKAQNLKWSDETKAKISASKKGIAVHTEEHKRQLSEQMKQRWQNGTRKRAEPKIKLTPEQRKALIAEKIRQRWADPVWAAKMKQRLSEGSKTRLPRSEQSKLKASLAQKGKPKKRKSLNTPTTIKKD